jgi:hypothetical protein
MANVTLLNSLIAMVLQDFPESLVVTMLVLSLLNFRFQAKKILAIAALQAVTNQLQLLQINSGIHVAIMVISLAIYIRVLARPLLSRSLLAALISYLVLIIVEAASVPPLLKIVGLALPAAYANPFLRSAFTLPYEVVLLLAALGKNYYNRKRGLIVEA